MLEQFYGWSGNLGFILGAILLARKKRFGFFVQILANLFYLFQSILMNNSSLLWLSLLLIFINLYGIIKWSK